MEKINWNEVEEAQEFERPTAGGYVCRIACAEDNPSKQYLRVIMDITEGKFKDFGMKAEAATGNDWSYFRMFRSYKPSARGFFKNFLSELEKSNPSFKVATWDNDETKLSQLKIGVVMGEEEYQGNDGKVKTRLYVAKLTTPDKIRANDYKVPELKKLKQDSYNAPVQPSVAFDESCPF